MIQLVNSQTRNPTFLDFRLFLITKLLIISTAQQWKQLGHAEIGGAQVHSWLLVLIFTQVEELNSEIEELNAAFAKVKEARQKPETQKSQVSVPLGEEVLSLNLSAAEVSTS